MGSLEGDARAVCRVDASIGRFVTGDVCLCDGLDSALALVVASLEALLSSLFSSCADNTLHSSKVFVGKRQSNGLCFILASTCSRLLVCVALVQTCTGRVCIFVDRVCRRNRERRAFTPCAPCAK